MPDLKEKRKKEKYNILIQSLFYAFSKKNIFKPGMHKLLIDLTDWADKIFSLVLYVLFLLDSWFEVLPVFH